MSLNLCILKLVFIAKHFKIFILVVGKPIVICVSLELYCDITDYINSHIYFVLLKEDKVNHVLLII